LFVNLEQRLIEVIMQDETVKTAGYGLDLYAAYRLQQSGTQMVPSDIFEYASRRLFQLRASQKIFGGLQKQVGNWSMEDIDHVSSFSYHDHNKHMWLTLDNHHVSGYQVEIPVRQEQG
jgi:hypothetical protein